MSNEQQSVRALLQNRQVILAGYDTREQEIYRTLASAQHRPWHERRAICAACRRELQQIARCRQVLGVQPRGKH